MSAVIVSVLWPVDRLFVWILQVFSILNILSVKTAYKQGILKLMLCCEVDD